MTLAIGYLRVSTRDQADYGLSLEAQLARIEAQAVVDDLTIISVVEDAAASARSMRRAGLQNVITAVQAGRTDVVLVADLSRFTRSIADLGRLLEIFDESPRASGGLGVSLISATDHFDTSTATGRFARDLMVRYSQYEREVISERTIRALDVLKNQGKVVGNPPRGYGADSNGNLIPDAKERHILEIAEAMRAEGLTYAEIAAELNRMGHVTRAGTPWSRQAMFKAIKTHADRRQEQEVE